MNTVASLPDRLAMHARDCAKAADMDTDVVLSREQIDAMADDMAEAALALAAPAVEGGLPEGHPQAPMPAGWLTLAVPGGTESGRDFVHGPRRAIEVCQRALLAATAEQPGSAVQGEKCCGYCCPACGRCYTCHRRALDCLADSLTTPPPAPAAEQGDTCPKCGATSEDDAGSKCIPDGDSCPGVESPLAEAWAQPEARGVEELRGLVRLWRTVEKNGERVTQFDKGYEQASDECADALETVLNSLATHNPVRAEQPEGEGKWPEGLVVLGTPINAIYTPPGYAIDGNALRDERVLRFVAAAPAAPVGVDEAMVARAEAYMLRVLPCKSTACLGGTFNFYELLTASLAGKAQEESK